jgi:predicted ester cyclase
MTTEQNKAIDRRFIEDGDNKGDLGVIDELLAPNYVFHFPPNPPLDGAGVKHALMVFRTAFPDLHQTTEDQIAEGNSVVARRTVRGTHRGDFQGIPPTGKQVTIPAISLMHLESGQVVEHWVHLDLMGLMQQLGVAPAPAQPTASAMDTAAQSSSGVTTSTTSMDHNKGLVRRVFEEGFTQGNAGVFDEVLAPNYVNHDFPMPVPGREGLKQVLSLFRAAFPDLRVSIEDEVAEGDRVASRGYFAGTHRGEFMGLAPTGKPINVAYIDMWRVENGQLVENWVRMDMVGMMQQLGAIPTPSGAAAIAGATA